MGFTRLRIVGLLGLSLLPTAARGQVLFDWPLRASPQPEAVLFGAGAVFWNPGGLSSSVGSEPEVWVLHVDGPDATGIGGAALAGVFDLPTNLRVGVGYSHLGIDDIPRTSTSPTPDPGEINVSEDIASVALAWSLGSRTGVGGAVRVYRGAAAGDAHTHGQADIGIHHRSNLPLSPRFGVALAGLGRNWRILGGSEALLGRLAAARIPIRFGYGFQLDRSLDPLEHRVSLRASWMDQFRLGMGLSFLGEDEGWSPLWMLGADLGRYSIGVLRESLANDFGPVHFFRASVQFH